MPSFKLHGQVETLETLAAALHHVKVQQKILTNKRSISTTIYFFLNLHILKHAIFDQAGKNCTDNINILFSWQWHELFIQWYFQ